MHMRFPDGDEAVRAGGDAQAGPSGSAGAGTATRDLQPVARHQMNVEKRAQGYCMGLALSHDRQILAAAQSSGRIELLAPADAALECVFSLEGHTDAVTGLAFNGESDLLFSCSTDGAICMWDARAGQAVGGCAQRLVSVPFTALCLTCSSATKVALPQLSAEF